MIDYSGKLRHLSHLKNCPQKSKQVFLITLEPWTTQNTWQKGSWVSAYSSSTEEGYESVVRQLTRQFSLNALDKNHIITEFWSVHDRKSQRNIMPCFKSNYALCRARGGAVPELKGMATTIWSRNDFLSVSWCSSPPHRMGFKAEATADDSSSQTEIGAWPGGGARGPDWKATVHYGASFRNTV